MTKLHHLHRTLSANHGKITQADLVASSGRRPLQTSEIPEQAATSSSGCNIKHVRLLAVSGHGSTSCFPCSLITEAAAAVPPRGFGVGVCLLSLTSGILAPLGFDFASCPEWSACRHHPVHSLWWRASQRVRPAASAFSVITPLRCDMQTRRFHMFLKVCRNGVRQRHRAAERIHGECF